MQLRFIISSFFTVSILAGCACHSCGSYSAQQEPTPEMQARITLSEAATSVSHSLINLNNTEQAANPPQNIAEPPDPSTYGMGFPASLNWNGPIEPAIQKIANATSYEFKTVGKAPSLPILISIHEENSTLGDILHDIGVQAKHQAEVVVLPKRKIIELRYLSK